MATLRSWVIGRPYPVRSGERYFPPVIALPRGNRPLLSFFNLVEAHVLDAIRRQHHVPLPHVRSAIRFLSTAFGSRHPLADHRFETDGFNLFVEKLGQLINVSQAGQLAMRELLRAHLRRIEWDPQGRAARLYLFVRKRQPDEPRVVVIDPLISFGRPVLAGTGIPTAVVADRFKAGESVHELAADYARHESEILEAIRCELREEAA
jgi:uncharacterized protein (DUF433 family)